MVALRIPNVGELSRKEREDNHPLFDKKKGAKFIDDFKRLAKSFPDSVDKIRELTGAQEGDFVIVVAGDPAHHIKASDTKFEGRLSASARSTCTWRRATSAASWPRNMPTGMGHSTLPKKWSGRAIPNAASKLLTAAAAFHPMWIVDFPMFEYDVASGKWVPAHHPFTAPYEADMANLVSDPRQRARRLLRPRDERTGAGIRVDPYPSQGRAAADLRVAGHLAMKRRGSASDSSWMRWSTAPLRMAALRWDWTAS